MGSSPAWLKPKTYLEFGRLWVQALRGSSQRLTLSLVDCGFKPCVAQANDYTIGICCFSTIKYILLRSNNKDGLAGNHDHVSVWSNMFTCGLLFDELAL